MKVSVITITYNSEKSILRTIRSVNAQSYENIEHIFVDGSSQDSTLKIIQDNAKRNPVIVSEPDTGIYDAWNKAFRLATGDLICFCNSDDILPEDCIRLAVSSIQSAENKIFYGDVKMFYEKEPEKLILDRAEHNVDSLYRGFKFRTTTLFIPKESFQRVGFFDTTFRIAGDSEWLLRAHHLGFDFQKLGHSVHMSLGGISNVREYEAYREYLVALRKYQAVPLKSYWVLLKKSIKQRIGCR
ncbi:glycosyltransferase family 2 protein [Shewanella sp.]|uniref:glycosyltransferase family 2 protein n=1 Tax=Shewanella sp. TaxID=50422 RepID=UPI00356387AF